MPDIRQRTPKKLDAETARTSIGANSAIPIHCRMALTGLSLLCDWKRVKRALRTATAKTEAKSL